MVDSSSPHGTVIDKRSVTDSIDPLEPSSDTWSEVTSKTSEDTVGSFVSFSERSLRKWLLSDSLQHPFTIIPGFVAGLAALILMSRDLFRGSSSALVTNAAIVVLLGSAAVTTISFVRLYFFRYDQVKARREQEMFEVQDRKRRADENRELQRKRATLRMGFPAIGSSEGQSALARLEGEFRELEALLARMTRAERLFAGQIPALAGETYRQCLGLLSHALELSQAIRASNKQALAAEADELVGQIATLRADRSQAERVRIREATLASRKEALELIGRQDLHVEELLHGSDLGIAALQKTRMELAALTFGGPEIELVPVGESLQQAIDQAREIQEELRGLGYRVGIRPSTA